MIDRPHVLIVDDDRDNREVLGEYLRDEFSVTLAADGEQALKLIAKPSERFDLLIADLEMPKMDGADLVTELRRRHIHVPVLVVSGALDGRERAAEIEVEFVKKPLDLRRLHDKLDRLLCQAG